MIWVRMLSGMADGARADSELMLAVGGGKMAMGV